MLLESFFPEDEPVPKLLMGHGGADYNTVKAFVKALHVCYDFILLYLPSYHFNKQKRAIVILFSNLFYDH